MCANPAGVAIRPLGVRSIRPQSNRNGSYTSSTVSGRLAHCDRQRRQTDRASDEGAAQRVEDGPVDLVEAELVDLEQRERVARDGAR